MKLRLTKHRILAACAIYSGIVAGASLAQNTLGIISTILIFPFLIFVPGRLLLYVFKSSSKDMFVTFFYAVCLSLLLLMVMGLTANWLLPVFGIVEPLRTLPLLCIFSSMMTLLLIAAHHRAEITPRTIDVRIEKWYSYVPPVVFVLMAIMGAIRLNNGVSNYVTVCMLALIAFDLLYITFRIKEIRRSVLLTHLYGIALSLLLMTSLRGWFVTGHDVQREFYVFQLTKSQWHWFIGAFRDPYNACMSITVLPTVLVSLMKLSDPYVYKVLFQMLFALCPVIVYILVRRISNRVLAVLGFIYFVAFPTYFSDMPMLNRQEIAFLFFAGLLLLLGEKSIRYAYRVALFWLFGVGIILSHYSTTYALLVIFIAAACIRFVLERKVTARVLTPLYARLHRTMPVFIGKRERERMIVVPLIAVLTLIALVWNVQITKTSKGILDTATKAVKSITSNIKDDTRSSDTGASIFGGAKPNPRKVVEKYKEQQETKRTSLPKDNVYPADSYKKYTVGPAYEATQSLTVFGQVLSRMGLNVYSLIYTSRQSFAKVLQLLVLLGLSLFFFSKRLKLHPSAEFVAMSMASIFFLLILLFVPSLSLDYGLLRAFQQVLIVLALPTALGSMAVAARISRKYAIPIASAIAVGFFALSSGLISELTGGYQVPLHLHNDGMYYNSYYFHEGEDAAVAWLTARVEDGVLITDAGNDRLAANDLRIESQFELHGDVYPGVITQDAYVFIGDSPINKRAVYAIYQNEAIYYTYPIDFLEQQKNVLYSNEQARIYR